MKTLDILAFEWYDKVNGNSYFSAKITIDNDKVLFLPFQYGYGNAFEYEAKAVLTEHNFISPQHGQSLYTYCKDNNILFTSNKIENCLKRELKNLVK